jgi:hypothetical protein
MVILKRPPSTLKSSTVLIVQGSTWNIPSSALPLRDWRLRRLSEISRQPGLRHGPLTVSLPDKKRTTHFLSTAQPVIGKTRRQRKFPLNFTEKFSRAEFSKFFPLIACEFIYSFHLPSAEIPEFHQTQTRIPKFFAPRIPGEFKFTRPGFPHITEKFIR